MRSNMLQILGVILIPLSLAFSVQGLDNNKTVDIEDSHVFESVFPGETVNGPEYDAFTPDEMIPNPYYNSLNRSTADTMSYCPDVGGQFVFVPGDFMVMFYQMPADGIIKGVNIPVFQWADAAEGTEDQLEVSVWKVNYPTGSDGQPYDTGEVDGGGWLGYAWDGADHSTAGVFGNEWYGDGDDEVGQCAGGAAVSNATDPLMEQIWPSGFQSATFTPSTTTEQEDNWFSTVDFGSEPTALQDEWVAIVVENQGTFVEYTGFYYCEGAGVVDPWVFAKFYGTECDGTGGETGWYVRHWVVHWPLAVELTGDRPPVFGDVTSLATTLSTDARTVEAMVTDDNPSGGEAGVASVSLFWSTDTTWTEVAMVEGDTGWSGEIPGQVAGSAVSWYLVATDVLGGVAMTVTNTYNIFAAENEDLFIYNSDHFGSWIQGYYQYSAPGWMSDFWSFGAATTELVDNYQTIAEISGGGPLFCSEDSVLSAWLDAGGKNYINAGDEWMGTCVDGWTPTEFAAGTFMHDYMGIAHSWGDINYGGSGDQGGVSRLMAVEGDAISGDLAAFLGDSLDLNYDPNYEIGADNWLDGVDAADGTTVAYTGYGGILDSTGSVDPEATEYSTGIYTELANGSKTAFFGFDVLSLNTTPSYYWIGIDGAGPLPKTLEWMGETILGVENTPEYPESFILHDNFPNPFNPVTNISFELPMYTDVNLTIYNLMGQSITTLVDTKMESGYHQVSWNGSDAFGNQMPSGVYFYKVTTENATKTNKMLLLK